MEVRLYRFGIVRHFGVDNFAEWIEVERHAAVVAILGFEATLMLANFGDTGFLEERDHGIERIDFVLLRVERRTGFSILVTV